MSRAKTLNSEQYHTVMARLASVSRHVERDAVIVAATFKAGLRAAEVAGLRWCDVCDPFGAITQADFEVPNHIAKKGSGRALPMHPAFYAALLAYRATLSLAEASGTRPVVRRVTSSAAFTANHLQKHLGTLYAAMGLQGVSSHSGRRSYLTALARATSKFDCSLRDVQHLAGHKHIGTTEIYVERSARVWEMVEAV